MNLGDSRQVLVFSVGPNHYAMDILHLKEVGRMPGLEMPAQGSGEGLGIIRMHGCPVRVYDLAMALNLPAFPPSSDADSEDYQSWLIVSRTPEGERHWRVDSVDDIVEYDPDRVVVGDDASRSVARDVLELDGRLTYLLTPERLAGVGP